MNIRKSEHGGISALSIIGSLSQGEADEFELALMELHERGKTKIVIDLSECGYITSLNLSILLYFKKLFVARGGDIGIVCANNVIVDLFEKTNLNKVVRLYPTLEEALSGFRVLKGLSA